MKYLRTRIGLMENRYPIPPEYGKAIIEQLLKDVHGVGMVLRWPDEPSHPYGNNMGLYIVNDGIRMPMTKIFYLS